MMQLPIGQSGTKNFSRSGLTSYPVANNKTLGVDWRTLIEE